MPTIDLPASGTTWKVGDGISFSGHATDPEDGQVPPAALSWSVTIQHCPSDCHTHPLEDRPGVAFGTFAGVDHEYPSHLELTLTARDSTGLTASTSLRLDPKTVDLSFASAPTGLRLVVGSTAGTTPFTRRVIVGSNNSIIADTQSANGRRYAFNSWSDGGEASHNVIAGETPATYTATFDDIGPAGAPGLAAAYSFDEGSGATATDLAGKGNNGTLTNGATWAAAGKYGGAISFDGVNDLVTIADSASLDLTTGMTLAAWVRPSVTGWPYRTVVMKEQPGGLAYAMYLTDQTRPLSTVFSGGAERVASGTAALAANTWTHLAATYDGTNLRLYVNGTLVTTTPWSGTITASTGALRIGANTIWPEEAFQGLIDEVRVYNRALTLAELNSDMATPLGEADTTAPSKPTGFVSSGSTATSIATGWSASSDNVGVAGYRLFLDGAQAGPPTQQTSFTFTGLVCGSTHTLGVEAYDLAGNTSGRATLDASAGACDTTPPTVAITAPAAGATVANTVSVTANAADNDQVSGVQFRLDGANLGAEDTTGPYAVSWDTRTVANGAHTLTAVARDPSGNITTSANVAVTVTNSAQPPGLVAAYSFDQGSGTAAPDASGTGNNGTLTNGPTWAAAGKYGGAISFDGVNDMVTITDSASLDLTTGMTLQAWVRPTTLGTTWRTVVFKQRSSGLVYGLYANRNTQRPNGADLLRQRGAHGGWNCCVPAERMDAPRCDLRRGHAPALRQRHPSRSAAVHRIDHDVERGVADRRQLGPRRVVPGPDRRGTYLQPRTLGSRGPERHDPLRRCRRHDAALRSGESRRNRLDVVCAAELECVERCRRRRPLQRPPIERPRLHPGGCQSDRAADRPLLHRHRALLRLLLLQGHCPRRRRQHRRRLERGQDLRHRRHPSPDSAGQLRHDGHHEDVDCDGLVGVVG